MSSVAGPFSLRLYRRDFLDAIMPDSLDWTVTKLGKSVFGGCSVAELAVTGTEEDLKQLLSWIRYGIEVWNLRKASWWGVMAEIQVTIGYVTWTVSIDDLVNRAAVAYTIPSAGESSGSVKTQTEWAEADASIDEFGTRELLDTSTDVTQTLALAHRAWLLNTQQWPVARPKVNRTAAIAPKAVVRCVGWWKTLDWLYCSVPSRLAYAFLKSTTANQTVGRDYTDASLEVVELAQAVDIGGTAIVLNEIGVRVRRVGTPASALTVTVYSNASDADPSSSLASATIAAALIPTSYTWCKATLSSPITLAADTSYWVSIQCTTKSATDYYVARLDGDGRYTDGPLKQKVVNWSTLTGKSMPFRLYTNAVVETSQQVKNILTAFGQFFDRVVVEVASGISTESYRPGTNDALDTVERLMRNGTSNDLRMLAEVDEYRRARVYEEPTAGEEPWYYLGADGCFYDERMAPIDPTDLPCGFWAKFEGDILANLDTSRLSGLDKFFVDTVEWSASAPALLQFTSRGTRSPYIPLREK